MSVFNANKTIDKQTLDCGEKALVTISFDSKSELSARPADIILIMDESGSMSGERLQAAQRGANDLIDIVTKASAGLPDQLILNGSRIGIVGFSTTAAPLVNLTDDVVKLKEAVNNLKAGGNTNHEDAFIKAKEMIDLQSTNDKIVIMFTDGISTAGGDANTQATLLKNDGVEIFCLSLGTNRDVIDLWASDPVDTHVAITNDVNEVDELFRNVAYDVIKAGAKDVLITEKLNNNFKITDIISNNPGIVEIKDLQTLEWKMDVVGITNNDLNKLVFEVEYIGKVNETVNVNESIIYKDKDNNQLTFPDPTIELTCNTVIIVPDTCNNATTLIMDGCKDSDTLLANVATVQDLGRVVQVNIPINNVCPNKRLALGVILTEVDNNGVEHNRGMKTVLINPIVSTKCENIMVKCVNFAVPESLDMTNGADTICNTRTFKVRTLINYIDTDFTCCDSNTVIVE